MKEFEFIFIENFNKIIDDLFINKNVFKIYIINNNLIANLIILNIDYLIRL